MQYFQLDISDVIEIYNHTPQILQKQAVKVSLTETSLINQPNEPITLTVARNGNYWVIATEDENYWLFPKANLKIDAYKFETFQRLFKCYNYHNQNASLLTLIKPASISLMPNSRDWKLEELGEINFINSSPAIDLQQQLELADQEINQLQMQLDKLNQERNLLLGNFQQLNTDIQRERQEKQRLFSLIETKLTEQGKEISYIKNHVAEIKNHNLPATSNTNIPNSLILKIKNFLKNISFIMSPKINQYNFDYYNLKIEEARKDYEQLYHLINQFENPDSFTSEEYSNFNTVNSPSITSETRQQEQHQDKHIDDSEYREKLQIQSTQDTSEVYSNSDSEVSHIPWLKDYNENPESCQQYQPIRLSITDESINKSRLGSSQPIVLESNIRGSYWIFCEDNIATVGKYLVPLPNLKINPYTLIGISMIFDFRPDNFDYTTKFKVIFPALVIPIEHDKWELKARGILEFDA